jgi:hypothetical protein
MIYSNVIPSSSLLVLYPYISIEEANFKHLFISTVVKGTALKVKSLNKESL